MWLLMASLFGLLLLLAVVFFVLKLLAATANSLPGTNYVFSFFINTVPYFILFGAYYLVHKKISAANTNASSVSARLVLTIGSLLCLAQLAIAILTVFNLKYPWLQLYNEYNKAGFALHLIMILIAAGLLATGDTKEKNWMDRSEGDNLSKNL